MSTALIGLNAAKYETDAVRTRAFWDALMMKVHQIPGVTEAAMNSLPPLMWDWEVLCPFTIDDQPDPGPGNQPTLVWQMVSSGYLGMVQVPILKGRDFDSQDTADKPSVTIVDAAMAQCYFPGENPLGKGINVQTEEGIRHCTIIGVVPHLRYKSPGREESAFQAYFPYTQWDWDFECLILRSDLDLATLIPAIRKAVASIDPGVPSFNEKLYDNIIAEKLVTRRLSALLITLFSGAALFLSAIGIYGQLAYSVGQRTREIGIRIALGAQVSNILKLITEQGLKIVSIGLLLGIGVALVTGRLIEGLLFGVSPIDVLTLLVSIVILCIAAGLACLLPALRAVRINPTTALRE